MQRCGFHVSAFGHFLFLLTPARASRPPLTPPSRGGFLVLGPRGRFSVLVSLLPSVGRRGPAAGGSSVREAEPSDVRKESPGRACGGGEGRKSRRGAASARGRSLGRAGVTHDPPRAFPGEARAWPSWRRSSPEDPAALHVHSPLANYPETPLVPATIIIWIRKLERGQ